MYLITRYQLLSQIVDSMLWILPLHLLGHDLYFPSQIFLLHHKARCPLPLYFPRVIITDKKSLLSLWTWFRFLGFLLKSLPPITSIEVKNVSPILYFDGSIYLAIVSFCFNFDQYFFVTLFSILFQTNILAWPANSNTNFSFKILSPRKVSKDPLYGRGKTWYLSRFWS